MSINPLVTRLRGWVTVFFDELWRMIPAEPYLFPFFLIGALITVISPPTQGVLGPGATFDLWICLAFTSPFMVLLAWYLVMHCTGEARYIGLWLRLGGDASQFFVLTLYLLARFTYPNLTMREYGLVVVVGVDIFLLMLVVRDFLALWLVLQLASKLSKETSRARDAGT